MSTYDKAESKPWMALLNVSRIVPAVVAPTYDPFITFDFFPESMLATGKYETHGALEGDSSVSMHRIL